MLFKLPLRCDNLTDEKKTTTPVENPETPIRNSIEKPLAFQKFKIIVPFLHRYIKAILLILSHSSQYWLHFVHFHSPDPHFFFILATEYLTFQFFFCTDRYYFPYSYSNCSFVFLSTLMLVVCFV